MLVWSLPEACAKVAVADWALVLDVEAFVFAEGQEAEEDCHEE